MYSQSIIEGVACIYLRVVAGPLTPTLFLLVIYVFVQVYMCDQFCGKCVDNVKQVIFALSEEVKLSKQNLLIKS